MYYILKHPPQPPAKPSSPTCLRRRGSTFLTVATLLVYVLPSFCTCRSTTLQFKMFGSCSLGNLVRCVAATTSTGSLYTCSAVTVTVMMNYWSVLQWKVCIVNMFLLPMKKVDLSYLIGSRQYLKPFCLINQMYILNKYINKLNRKPHTLKKLDTRYAFWVFLPWWIDFNLFKKEYWKTSGTYPLRTLKRKQFGKFLYSLVALSQCPWKKIALGMKARQAEISCIENVRRPCYYAHCLE